MVGRAEARGDRDRPGNGVGTARLCRLFLEQRLNAPVPPMARELDEPS
jgi:hypothetical protein